MKKAESDEQPEKAALFGVRGLKHIAKLKLKKQLHVETSSFKVQLLLFGYQIDIFVISLKKRKNDNFILHIIRYARCYLCNP